MSERAELPASMQPFVPTTTPKIERANHLISILSHPGFQDIMQISQQMVQEAADVCADYPGWDTMQIVVLKVRMQTAKEHHDVFLARIKEAIRDGVAEGQSLVAEQKLPPKTPQEAIEHGDFVRQRVLEKFTEMDTARETRAPGSF